MKTCAKCKAEKPAEQFDRNAKSRDGRYSYCKACVKAAQAERYLKNKDAIAARNKAWAAANPEKVKAKSRRHYESNREARNAKSREFFKANPGKAAEYSQRWREKNPGKAAQASARWYRENRERALAADKARREKHIDVFLARERAAYAKHAQARRARGKKWRQKNKGRVAHHAALRRAMLLQRTPGWLTSADLSTIAATYARAKALTAETGILHHVDHVLPLRGRYVSGLHVPANLAVLPAPENLKKSNLWSPE